MRQRKCPPGAGRVDAYTPVEVTHWDAPPVWPDLGISHRSRDTPQESSRPALTGGLALAVCHSAVSQRTRVKPREILVDSRPQQCGRRPPEYRQCLVIVEP